MSVDTAIESDLSTIVVPYEDVDDGKEHRTHIVNPPMNRHITQGLYMEPQDIVDMARVTGQEVVALCEYKFVPVRNPEKYDVCQDCIRVAGDIMRSKGQ